MGGTEMFTEQKELGLLEVCSVSTKGTLLPRSGPQLPTQDVLSVGYLMGPRTSATMDNPLQAQSMLWQTTAHLDIFTLTLVYTPTACATCPKLSISSLSQDSSLQPSPVDSSSRDRTSIHLNASPSNSQQVLLSPPLSLIKLFTKSFVVFCGPACGILVSPPKRSVLALSLEVPES